MRRRGSAGTVRFITFSCAQRKRLLATPRLRDLVTFQLRAWIEPHDIAMHAWVVLSNHIHLLLTPRSGDLGRSLAILKKDTAIAVLPHLHNERKLWQAGGGYDREIWSHQHFWKTYHYIHQNPCVAGLAKLPTDWRWSSATEWFGRPRDHAPQVEPPPDWLIDLSGTV